MVSEASKDKPFVSVIMPVYNESAYIGRSLGALLEQTYPNELMEIVVADGMSTDDTRKLIEDLRSATEIPITVLDNVKKIAPCALNLAIAASRGEIIVRVDGHCVVERDYVENCLNRLMNGDAEGVGGPIETIGETFRAQAIAIAMSSKFGVGGSAFRTIDDREMYVDTVAFPGYRRETLETAGPFNEELVRNQDDEFNYRLRKSGGRILLAPEIKSKYYSRSGFRKLWRQYFQYGHWKIRVLQLHPKQMSLRQFAPWGFVSTVVVLALTSMFWTPASWALIGLLTAYVAILALGAVLAAGPSRLRYVPFVFMSFVILHLSYGIGFWSGILKFLMRSVYRVRKIKSADLRKT